MENLYKIIRLKVKRIKKFIRRRRKILTAALILLAVLFLVWLIKEYVPKLITKKDYYQESSYCETDADCALYSCTNCGNILWLDDKLGKDYNMSGCRQTTGIIGCACVDSVCKRVRK